MPDTSALARCTLEGFETRFAGRHLLHGAVAYWARIKPDTAAIVSAGDGAELSWRELDETATALARRLVAMGFEKGDFLAASLPFSTDHILLEYACFKAGVIHAPLDLRLKPQEVIRSLGLVQAKGYAFPGVFRGADFRELARAVQKSCPFVRRFFQFSKDEAPMEGAVALARGPERAPLPAIDENDGAQVIFTTGSTGAPKPALLSHRNITCQNMCLGAAFGFGAGTRLLVNLPPSHVGGQAEALMTTLCLGGVAVVMEAFDPAGSLKAIERHRVNMLGQIPAMYNYEWRLADYGSYDLSSLTDAIYGGQQVSVQFLERLGRMAPSIRTGLGLTEAAGFCTFTTPGAGVEGIQASIGFDMPVYPLSVRLPMDEAGAAGAELPDGEVGHICFRGPQTFLGYVNDPAATAAAISSDGYLYTGDMGFKDSAGLHFAGRAKWVIKPAGHQIFPGDVENHICALEDKVASCGVVGADHRLLTEAVVAFVEKKPGAELDPQLLKQHGKALASYMRPLHYVILEPGQMPLNRAAKTDYVRLHELAQAEVARLRENRRWDA